MFANARDNTINPYLTIHGHKAKRWYSFMRIDIVKNDGICCKDFYVKIECTLCGISVKLHVSAKFRWNFYSDAVAGQFMERLDAIHSHKNITDKLVRVKCDADGKDFYIKADGVASIDDPICPNLNYEEDVLCGYCNKPKICDRYYHYDKLGEVNLFASSVYYHYNEHSEELKSEAYDAVNSIHDIINHGKIILADLESQVKVITPILGEIDNIDIISRIISVKGDCDCGYQKLFECNICGRKWKADRYVMVKSYKRSVKEHFRKNKVNRNFTDFIDKNACVLCGQEYLLYGGKLPAKEIVLNHFDSCLKQHEGQAAAIGNIC